MVAGRVHLYRLTIPEGYNLVQIAAAVAAAGLESEKRFLDAARNPQMARSSASRPTRWRGICFRTPTISAGAGQRHHHRHDGQTVQGRF
jgi:cell division protein YceG involved in septum cleavage